MTDLYHVVGVQPDASAADIRAAYRLRLQLVHPDRHQGAPESVVAAAEAETARLTAAYAVLVDPAARSRYDTERRASARFDHAGPNADARGRANNGDAQQSSAVRPNTDPASNGPTVTAPANSGRRRVALAIGAVAALILVGVTGLGLKALSADNSASAPTPTPSTAASSPPTTRSSTAARRTESTLDVPPSRCALPARTSLPVGLRDLTPIEVDADPRVRLFQKGDVYVGTAIHTSDSASMASYVDIGPVVASHPTGFEVHTLPWRPNAYVFVTPDLCYYRVETSSTGRWGIALTEDEMLTWIQSFEW